MVEWFGPNEVSWPMPGSIEKELFSLLQDVTNTNSFESSKKLQDFLFQDREWLPTDIVKLQWPSYVPPVSSNAVHEPGSFFSLLSLFDGACFPLERLPGKYSGSSGLFLSVQGLVHSNYQDRAVALLNSAKAESSWKVSRSVTKKIAEAEEILGDLSFPWDNSKTASFVMYLEEEGLKASSIRTYLGHLKSLHMLNGHSWEGPTDPRIKMLLRGIHNSQPPTAKPIAVTPDILMLILKELKKSNWSRPKKRLIWSVALVLFFGSLRSGEALSQKTKTYCQTLLY